MRSDVGRWIRLGGGVVVAASLVALGVFAIARMRPVVSITEIVEGPVVQAFYATGAVAPQREYSIKSNIAGVVTKMLVDKGDTVKKDQPLAIVTEPELDFKAKQAKAQLEESRLRADEKSSPVLREYAERLRHTTDMLEIAQREQNRLTNLVASTSASQMDLDRALDRVKELSRDVESIRAQGDAKRLELQKDLEVAQAAASIADWNLQQQTLKSPIEGVVLDRPISLGTRLAINDHLMQVADVRPENLVMRAQVDEEDVGKIRLEGDAPQKVVMTFYSFPDRVFQGTVQKLYDKADSDRRTFEVDVTLPKNDRRFLPGMTGELAFVVQSKDKALVVPSQAVQSGKVYTIRDGKVEATNAAVGIRGVERAEITGGMNPGDVVLISPVDSVKVGQPVRTQRMDPTAAAGLNKPKEKEIFRGGF